MNRLASMSLPSRFDVLGPVMVVGDDGRPVPPQGTRARLLVAVLAARRGRVVTVDELVDALWGDEQPEHPAAALQSQIHRLRRQLGSAGEAVATVGAGYRLDGRDDLVDAARFEATVAAADAHAADPDVALAFLDEGLGLWRGRAFLEVADHDAIRSEALRLEELRAAAAETRAELLLAIGRVDEAAAAAEAVTVEHPYRERPVAVRMRALARRGRHAEALRAYDDLRRRLGDDLGLEPSPELRDLEGDVLRHEGRAASPSPRLGLPGNSFVGRELDLAAASDLIGRARLVSMTGPGGIGKTRLAIHTAVRVADSFPDGVYLCELASVGDPAAVAGAVASTLQVEERGAGREALVRRIVDYLGTKRALLVLDNCEHVLDAAAGLVADVLVHAPDVVVLATSRQRLGVEGEHVLPLQPLAVPEPATAGPAVSLFVDRAAAVRPGREPTEDELATIAELCGRLDGLPLAIELAAARTLARPIEAILAEITDRLDRLGDARRRVERHRSIEAAMGWSYDLLAPPERAVFERLSAFSGGWTEDAATHVAGADGIEVASALTTLVEHSLVVAEPGPDGTRFSMLEPVRQYGQSRLDDHGQLDATRARHAVWVAGWLAAADAGLRGTDEPRWRRKIHTELSNVRAAHRWSIDHDASTAVAIVAALSWYAFFDGSSEVFGWVDETIDLIADEPPGDAGLALSRAFAAAAIGAWRRGDLARAKALAERGVAVAPSREPEIARFSWDAVRSAEALAGNYEAALAARDRVVALARRANDAVLEAHAHAAGALALGYLGAYDRAVAELAQAAAVLDVIDHPTTRAFVDYVAGEIRIEVAPADAIPLLRRARDQALTAGNRFVAGIAGASAVSAAARSGDPAKVIDEYPDLIEHFHRTGLWAQLWTVIRASIESLARLGRFEPAAVLYGALSATATASPVIEPDAGRLARAVSELRAGLGDAAFDRLVAQGAALGDEGAASYAIAECSPGPTGR
jgi:predicted ATPase/DNA-binding SARP family transcriptional activator